MFGDSCENHHFLSQLVRLLFGQLWETLGLLFISTSGHTGSRSTKKLYDQSVKAKKIIAAAAVGQSLLFTKNMMQPMTVFSFASASPSHKMSYFSPPFDPSGSTLSLQSPKGNILMDRAALE